MSMKQNMPEWLQMGAVSKSDHIFVTLFKHVTTDLPTGETSELDWVPRGPGEGNGDK